ncbi:hypothetical protein GCM10028818_07710 [Spirosoma horti]
MVAATTSIRKENVSVFAVVAKAAATPVSQIRVAVNHKDRAVIVLLVKAIVARQTGHRAIVHKATALRQLAKVIVPLHHVMVTVRKARVIVPLHQQIVLGVLERVRAATMPTGAERVTTPTLIIIIVRAVERATMPTGAATMPTGVERATTLTGEEPVVGKHLHRQTFKSPFNRRTPGCAVTRRTVEPTVGAIAVANAKMIVV